MQNVPESLEESAMLDGAGRFTILFRIMLPLIKATLATIILYYVIGNWNSWFNAMIYLRSSDKYPCLLYTSFHPQLGTQPSGVLQLKLGLKGCFYKVRLYLGAVFHRSVQQIGGIHPAGKSQCGLGALPEKL